MSESSGFRSIFGRVGAAVATVALVAAACIPPDPDPNAASVNGDGEFTLTMDEFSFLPSRITVDAGSTITVTVVNEGAVEHELMVGREVMPGGGYGVDLLGRMLNGGDPSAIMESALGTGSDPAGDAGHDESNSDGHHGDPATIDEPPMEPEGHGGDEPPAAEGDTHMESNGADDHADDGSQHGADDGADHHGGTDMDHAGTHITVQPGEAVEIVLAIPTDATGEWQIGCFVEGHFEAGMLGTMIIRESLR